MRPLANRVPLGDMRTWGKSEFNIAWAVSVAKLGGTILIACDKSQADRVMRRVFEYGGYPEKCAAGVIVSRPPKTQ